jgi:excisionase family DNA binding protein
MVKHMTDGKRALTPREFCNRYGIGLTKFYEELNAGRIVARKLGKATRISADDAEAWFSSLPTMTIPKAA